MIRDNHTGWTHKVVKTQLGAQGEWFYYPASATFSSAAAATEYAQQFAAEQAGVGGTRILVIAREGHTCILDLRPSAK